MREDDDLRRAKELSLQGFNHVCILKLELVVTKHVLIQLCWVLYLSSNSFPTEFNRSLPELHWSDEDSGNQDVMDTNYTEPEAESLNGNEEVLLKMSNITELLLQTCY